MRLCAELITREIERINIAAPELAAAFRQGGEDGVRVVLRKRTRRVLATIAENVRGGRRRGRGAVGRERVALRKMRDALRKIVAPALDDTPWIECPPQGALDPRGPGII